MVLFLRDVNADLDSGVLFDRKAEQPVRAAAVRTQAGDSGMRSVRPSHERNDAAYVY